MTEIALTLKLIIDVINVLLLPRFERFIVTHVDF